MAKIIFECVPNLFLHELQILIRKQADRNNIIILVVLTILNSIIALSYISGRSIWLDEGVSYFISKQSLDSIVKLTANDVHPPLYYFFLHYWMQFFVPTEFSLRVPSFLFGLIILYILFFVLLFSLKNKILSYFLVLVVAISPEFIRYQQEARMYTLLPLELLLVFVLYVKWTKNDYPIKYFIPLLLVSECALYTHNYGVIGLGAIFLVCFLFYQPINLKKILSNIILGILIFLLYLPWLGTLLNQINRQSVGGAIQTVSMVNLIIFVRRSIFVDFHFYPLDQWYFSVIFICLCFLMIIGIIQSVLFSTQEDKKEEIKFILILSLIGILFFIIPFGISFFKFPLGYSIYSDRYVLFSTILLKIGSSYFEIIGFQAIYSYLVPIITDKLSASKQVHVKFNPLLNYLIITIFILILTIPNFIVIQSPEFQAPVDDFRDAVHFIEIHSPRIEKIVLEAGFIYDPVSFYVNKSWLPELMPMYFSSSLISQLNQTLHQDKSFWVIRSHSQDPDNSIYTWLNSTNCIDQSFGSKGVVQFVDVTVFMAYLNSTV